MDARQIINEATAAGEDLLELFADRCAVDVTLKITLHPNTPHQLPDRFLCRAFHIAEQHSVEVTKSPGKHLGLMIKIPVVRANEEQFTGETPEQLAAFLGDLHNLFYESGVVATESVPAGAA